MYNKYMNTDTFVPDAIPYMMKSTGSLTILFINLIPLTRLAIKIHGICECMRNSLLLINSLQ